MRGLFVMLVLAGCFIPAGCGDDDCNCPTCPSCSNTPTGTAPIIGDLECLRNTAGLGEGGGTVLVGCSVHFIDYDRDTVTIEIGHQDCQDGSQDLIQLDVGHDTGGQQEGDLEFSIPVQTDCPEEGTYAYEIAAADLGHNKSAPLTLDFHLVAQGGEE